MRKITKNEKDVVMGFAVSDANEGWVFEEVVDYGEFGAKTCHIGHPIRYGYIVRNPETNEKHIYGSQCITKFWLSLYFKDLGEEKYEELYKKYQKLFVKFIKLIYQNQKYGLRIPKFPQTFEELEKTINDLKTQVKDEIKRRRGEIKRAMAQIEKEQFLKVKKKEFLKNNEEFRILINRKTVFNVFLHGFLLRFAQDMVAKFNQYGHVFLSDKQWDIVRQIADILRKGEIQGNHKLVIELLRIMPDVSNTWVRDTFIPSCIDQLRYKKNLSEKQWAVFTRYGIDIEGIRPKEEES